MMYMNKISVQLTEEYFNQLHWMFDLSVYWTNPHSNVYVLYGLPIEVQFDLDRSHFHTFNSQVG